MRFLRKRKNKNSVWYMSHPGFFQLPAFRLQRKLPTEEPWNVGGGKDVSSDPACRLYVRLFAVKSSASLPAQSRTPPLAAGCQRKTSRQAARRTGASHTPLGASVSPSASEEAGLSGLKALSGWMCSAALPCGTSSRGCGDHAPGPQTILLHSRGIFFVNRPQRQG